MNCKELGYEIGDRFIVVNADRLIKGAKIELIYDDGSSRPLFEIVDSDEKYYCSLEDIMPLKKMDIKEAYKIMSENCGIKIGDTVKVLRKAKDKEMGWDNVWSIGMDKIIGKEAVVVDILHDKGFKIYSEMYHFPFFVLGKTKECVEPIKLKHFNILFKDNGVIKIGRQTIDFETVKEIYERACKTLDNKE